MPKRKITPYAFSYYFSLGADRSYEKVASHYGVTKPAAGRDRWQERLGEAERQVREQANQKAVKDFFKREYERWMTISSCDDGLADSNPKNFEERS